MSAALFNDEGGPGNEHGINASDPVDVIEPNTAPYADYQHLLDISDHEPD